MGEYCRQYHLGRFIVIYYGSFAQVYGHLPKEDLAKRLRKVLLHEFRHHLESLAGERDRDRGIPRAAGNIKIRRIILEIAERHGNEWKPKISETTDVF